MFCSYHPECFAKPRGSYPCMKLCVDGHTITEQGKLLQMWVKHIQSLNGKSKISKSDNLQDKYDLAL